MPGHRNARIHNATYREKVRKAEKVIPAEKRCRLCELTKPSDQFYRMSVSRDGLQSYCIDCNKARRNGAHIESHGITVEQFNAMIVAQDGKCAVCAQPPRRQGNVLWTIDHDHECCPGEKSCGECVRGLLCNSCNRGLGLLGDSPEILLSAAAYLIAAKGE